MRRSLRRDDPDAIQTAKKKTESRLAENRNPIRFITLTTGYFTCLRRKHSIVFSIRQAIVIGPTPPGTGVMTDAIGSTAA